MPKFRKKPVVIEAARWFKNGDHPKDHLPFGDVANTRQNRERYDEYCATSEGRVVRYFRSPDVAGGRLCEHERCGRRMEEHGWIDTLEGGHIVCPGDWVITGVKGEFYPCKPDIFEATYEPAGLGQEWASKVTTQDAPDLPVMGAMGATGVDAALPEWVRDGVATARGLTPNDRAPYHHIYIWLADALGRTLDKLECAEHERDEARLDLAAERENLASVFSATHQQMCELADDLTQAREEIEERAHSEQNLVDLQQEQHKEIVALRKSLGEAQLVIEQQDRDYRRVTAEQEPPAAPPDEPEHDPNRCIGSRWD